MKMPYSLPSAWMSLAHFADILHGRACGSDAEGHVREVAVLRDLEAHRGGMMR
jgi:hypothetical protein